MLQVWKVVLAAVAVGSPASLGMAAMTGNLGGLLGHAPLAADPPAQPGSFGGKVLQEFTKTFDAAPAAGTLDLRIDEGAIHVFGWDKDAYLVQVLQADPGQAVSDYKTVIDFQDHSSADAVAFTLVVDQQGTYGLGVNGDPTPATAVVAFVPAATAFDRVFACSGQDSADLPPLPDPTPPSNPPPPADECVPADSGPSLLDLGLSILDTNNDNAPRVTFGVTGLHGSQLLLSVIYDDLQVEDASFDEAKLLATYGDLAGAGLAAPTLFASSEHGDIALEKLDVGKGEVLSTYGDITLTGRLDAGEVASEHGNIELKLADLQGGALEVRATYGDIGVHVPAGDTFGYDVKAATTYGDIAITLQDATVERKDDAAPGAGSGPSSQSATARTKDFDERAVQVHLDLASDHGDVTVTDGSRPAEPPTQPVPVAPGVPATPLAVPLLR